MIPVKKITAVFLVLVACGLYAQDNKSVTEELKKINGSLKKCPSVKMDVTYVYFTSYTSKVPLEVQKGKIKKKANSQLSELMGTTTVINDKYMLVVDSGSHRILVNDRKGIQAPGDVSEIKIDQLLKKYEQPTQVSSGKLSGLRFTCKKNVYAEHNIVEIYYSKKNYVIEKLVFYYQQESAVDPDKEDGPKDKPRLEVTFSNIDLDAGLTDTDFSEKNYIQFNGKQVKAAASYKQYTVLKNNR
jgi:predicted transcriptional regulator